MTFGEATNLARKTIFVVGRGPHDYRAFHDPEDWEERFPTQKLAAERVRYWRILRVAELCGHSDLDLPFEALEIADEPGNWHDVAWKLVEYLNDHI